MKRDVRGSRREREPAARVGLLFRAHVGWLEGHPVPGSTARWQTIPERGEPAIVELDPRMLGRAVRTLRELAREHPEAFAQVVALPDRIEPMLERVGAALRGKGDQTAPWSLFKPRVRELGETLRTRARAERAPVALIESIAWSAALGGLELDALRWLDDVFPLLAQLAPRVPLAVSCRWSAVLARHALDGARAKVRSVLELLGDEGTLDTRMRPVSAPEETREGRVEVPRGDLGRALVRICEASLAKATPARRRALDLALTSAPTGWVAQWQAEHARVAARARRDAAKEWIEKYPQPRAYWLASHAEQKKDERKPNKPTAPHAFDGDTWAEIVLREAEIGDEDGVTLARFIAAMPDEASMPGGRARLFVAFSRRLRSEERPRRFVELLRAMTDAMRRGAPAPAVLSPWSDALVAPIGRESPRTWREHDFDDVPAATRLSQVVAAIVALGPIIAVAHGSEVRGAFLALIADGTPTESAKELATRVPDAMARAEITYATASTVVLAATLAEHDAERFVAVLAPLLGERNFYATGALSELARRTGLCRALAHDLVSSGASRIRRWSQSLVALEAGAIAPEAAATGGGAEWISGYPKVLHAPLRALDMEVADAEHRAERLLGDNVRTVASVRRELDEIARRLELEGECDRPERQRLKKRVASLERRLADRRKLTAREREKLTAKIERAAERARLERVDDAIELALFRKVHPFLQVDAPPAWWDTGRAREIAAAIADLPPAERKLGFELLQRRSGEPPWLPYDMPANRRFLESMEERRIDTKPWLARNERTIDARGREVKLALEDDPLEILMMGEHFETCLSIGSFNFYSAVVNAADVNKRVLYARGPQGSVLGRCLLALTPEGTLLTFHPYAHDGSLQLGEHIASFVIELARKMNTHVVGTGHVPPLTNARWYDDGPRDLTGQLSVLRDKSELRRALGEVAPADVIRVLEEALRPNELDGRLLQLVMALPEIKARPELAVELAPRVFTRPFVPTTTRVFAAELVLGAGQPELAREVLRADGFWEWVLWPCNHCRRDCYPNLDATLSLLAELDPSAVLRSLRRTRFSYVHGWQDERGDRLFYLVIALRRLGRDGQAKRLCEVGVASGGHRRNDFERELARIDRDRAATRKRSA